MTKTKAILAVLAGTTGLILTVGMSYSPVKTKDDRLVTSDVVQNKPPEQSICTTYSYIEYLVYSDYSSFVMPNNKFGIYIYAEEDRFFKLADELVNSNGGTGAMFLFPTISGIGTRASGGGCLTDWLINTSYLLSSSGT